MNPVISFLASPAGRVVRIVAGERLAEALRAEGFAVRGLGLLRAVEVGQGRALRVARGLLERGFLTLPADAERGSRA